MNYKIMAYNNYGKNVMQVQKTGSFEKAKYLCRCYGNSELKSYGYFIEDEKGNKYNEFGRPLE